MYIFPKQLLAVGVRVLLVRTCLEVTGKRRQLPPCLLSPGAVNGDTYARFVYAKRSDLSSKPVKRDVFFTFCFQMSSGSSLAPLGSFGLRGSPLGFLGAPPGVPGASPCSLSGPPGSQISSRCFSDASQMPPRCQIMT